MMSTAEIAVRPRASREARENIVQVLRALRDEHGSLHAEYVRMNAKIVGCSERTMWRYISKGTSRRNKARVYKLSERDMELYFECVGNVSMVRKRLLEEGRPVPSLSTLSRAFDRDLQASERAHAVGGIDARRAASVYLRHEPPHRNALWEADHVELPVLVLPPGGGAPVKVWMTPIIDGFSRIIPGFALDVHPNAGTVLAALRKAIAYDPAYGPFCGRPKAITWDNGPEFLADAVTRVVCNLGISAAPAPAYSPMHKGKIERVQRTIQQELISGFSLYTNGPRALNGSLADDGPNSQAMTMAELYEHVAAWVHHYNNERPHSGLDGRTPREVWEADLYPIDIVPEKELRWMTTPSDVRKVGTSGIRWAKKNYIAPELNGLFGEEVMIGFVPHDERQIEVYYDGKFLCKALPQGTLDKDQRDAFLAARRESDARANKLAGRRNRKARVKHEPMTTPGEPEVITEITHEEARKDQIAVRQPGHSRRKSKAPPLISGLNQPVKPRKDPEAPDA